jgi:hypothetical protein
MNMEFINQSLYEYNSSYDLILRAVAEERNTNISLIISILDFGIRHWLSRKRFHSNEDIEQLSQFARSLAKGLFLLVSSMLKWWRTLPWVF